MSEKTDIQVFKELLLDFKEDMGSRFDELRGEIASTRRELRALSELGVEKDVKKIAEGHENLLKEFRAAQESKIAIEDVQIDTSILKIASTEHRKEIDALEVITKGHREEIDELKRA